MENAGAVLSALTGVTIYLDRSFRSFDALSLGKIYYQELWACERPGDPTDELIRTARGERRPGTVSCFFITIIKTAVRVGGEATFLGLGIYLISLIVGTLWLSEKLSMSEEPFLWFLLWVLLVPAGASLVALGLKWILLALTWMFSQVFAGLLFLLSPLIFLYHVLHAAHQADTAIEEVLSGKSSKEPTAKEPRIP